MSKLYKEDSLDVLKNGDKLTIFINEVLNGERPLYWESAKAKSPKYSQKLVGQDFEKRVFERDRDALVLIHHPVAEKNRGLKQKFEEFAKENLDENLLIARYSGVN